MNSVPNVVIIGRPNVGKSTLFNRLVGYKKALVHDLPGVTRDRIIQSVTWRSNDQDYKFSIIDTGGIGSDNFSEEIYNQVKTALKDATVLLIVFDIRTGVMPIDLDIIEKIRKHGCFQKISVIGVLNKADDEKSKLLAQQFYEMPLNDLIAISAEHNLGIEQLKELIVSKISSFTQLETMNVSSEVPPKVAIVGRPNVGKSTLLNTILGENRVITSTVPGTTSDAIDCEVSLGNLRLLLIDTAGIRKKSKTKRGLEVLSIVQVKKTLQGTDLAFLVLDGSTGMVEQDEKIAHLVEEAGCSQIILVNKWDTQKKNKNFTKKEAEKRIRSFARFLDYVPVLFISALKGEGLESLIDLVPKVLSSRKIQVPTHLLTELIRRVLTQHNPKNAKFYFCHQVSKSPPSFICHVNDPSKVPISLKGFLIREIRKKWGFKGTPIRMIFRKRT